MVQPVKLRGFLQADQRRIADRFDDAVLDMRGHGASSRKHVFERVLSQFTQIARGKNAVSGRTGSAAGHTHVTAHRRAALVAVPGSLDDEIMALGLARDGVLDRPRNGLVAL